MPILSTFIEVFYIQFVRKKKGKYLKIAAVWQHFLDIRKELNFQYYIFLWQNGLPT